MDRITIRIALDMGANYEHAAEVLGRLGTAFSRWPPGMKVAVMDSMLRRHRMKKAGLDAEEGQVAVAASIPREFSSPIPSMGDEEWFEAFHNWARFDRERLARFTRAHVFDLFQKFSMLPSDLANQEKLITWARSAPRAPELLTDLIRKSPNEFQQIKEAVHGFR